MQNLHAAMSGTVAVESLERTSASGWVMEVAACWIGEVATVDQHPWIYLVAKELLVAAGNPKLMIVSPFPQQSPGP
jgi:hypothetical protein